MSWLQLVGVTTARVLLGTVVCLLFWAAAPAVIGWDVTTVMSDSMAPRIRTGDAIAARPTVASQLRPGQVALVDDPDHPGRLRLHRVVQVRPDGSVLLRGDANAGNDSSPVPAGAVHGVGVIRVPHVGLPLVWVGQHRWGHLGAALLATAGLLAAGTLAGIRRGSDDSPRAGDDPPGSGPGPTTGAAAAHPGLHRKRGARSAAARSLVQAPNALWTGGAVVTVLVAASVWAAPAGAAMTATTADLSNSWAALPYYTCAAAVGADSPYLYYRFDETSGSTATDSSGNNRNGTFRGTGTTGGAARACVRDTGTAITLSGAGYVSTSTLIPTPPPTFTVEIWFKTTTVAGGKLIGFGSSQTGSSVNADRHLYMTNAGRIVFGVNPGTVKTVTSPATYNDGAWHHAAASLSAAGIVLYLDGQAVASDATVSTAATTAGYWRIGYDNLTGWPSAPSSSYIAATLDDAAVYTTALTATKISAHHAAGR